MKIRTFPGAFLACCLTFIGCGTLDRNPNSGYAQKSSADTPTLKRQKISEIPLSQKTRLKQLENSLSSKKEVEQYSKALSFFKDEAERIDFLSLAGFEARQKWLRENEFNDRYNQTENEMWELVQAQDIAVGMPQNLVRQSWGDPDLVEVSGNPQFKNERWKYNKFISTTDGFRPEKKIVYFEGGRVVGWEVE